MLAIFGKSLGGGFGAVFLVLVLDTQLPLVFDGPANTLGPIADFFASLGVFFIGFVLALLCQARLTSALPSGGRKIYALTLILALVPAAMLTPFAWWFVIGDSDFPSGKRMEFSKPLTEAERQLLRATHFDLTVAVRNRRYGRLFPPVYIEGLIRNLDKTGLFDRVGRASQTPDTKLIATIEATYWGDKNGAAFALALADNPEKSISIKVYYWYGKKSKGRAERAQYQDRLAVEVINAVNELKGQGR